MQFGKAENDNVNAENDDAKAEKDNVNAEDDDAKAENGDANIMHNNADNAIYQTIGKDHMEKKVLVIILVLLGTVFLLAAVSYSLMNPETMSPNEYVFIEHYVETQGVLADNPEVNTYVYMGYPTYNATTSQNLLKAVWFPTLNESLKVMLGNGKGIGKNACHGGEMYLYGAYELPYNRNNITIKNVDKVGTVNLDYDGKPLVLESGASWYNNSSSIQLIHFTNNTVDEYIKVNISVIDRFRNFGIYTKGLE